MKKIVSALLVVMLIFGMLPVIAMAADTTATITFDNTSKRTVFTTSQQVWVENGITVTNNKASSSSNVANYAKPARFYKSSQLIVEYPSMTQIVFDCNSSSYATALKSSCAAGTYSSIAVSSDKVTVTFAAPQDSFTIASMTGGQVRMDGLTVTAQAGETVECDHPTSTVQNDAVAPGCVNPGYTATEKCDTCGATTKLAEEIPALGHSYVEGFCAACQEWEANSTLTAAQASAMGLAKGNNNYTSGKYYVTGTITSIANTTYGNLTIQDETGSLYIYGVYSEDGNTRYDALENKPIVGDTVTLYGIIGAYNDIAQMKNGYMTAFDPSCEHANTTTVSGKTATCTETGLTEGTVCADCGYVIEAQTEIPAMGHYYEDGECVECGALEGEFVPGYYLVTDASKLSVGDTIVIVAADSAIALSTEQKSNNRGQIAITKGDGTIEINDNVQILTLESGKEAGTFAFYTGSGYLYAASSGSNYLKTQTTLDANGSWTIEITADGVATVLAQGANTRNWMQYNQTNGLFACYAVGKPQKDIAIYKYETGEVEVECEHDSVVQDDALAPTCTQVGYTATEKCSKCGETTKFAEEIPALGHSYVDNFCNVCKEWTADSTLTIPQATEMGLAKGHNNYTEGKYYMTVVVVDVYNTQYGNMNVTDADGNKFVIFGTYSADGNTRYDAMETKPVAGDTITVYGIIGAFNDAAQMKNGWIIEIKAAPVCEHTNTTELADGKNATCTETGLTNTVVCADCGETVTAQTEIPAYGHAWTEQEELAPTCIHAGHLAHFECCVCLVVSLDKETLLTKEEVQLAINPDAHAWDEGVYTEPTTEADGYTTYTCTLCAETEVEVDEGSKLPAVVENAIIAQPQDVTAESGETVQFHVEAQGEVVSYKWEYRKISKWFNTSMEGYNTDTLTVGVTGARNGYDYRCVITFADGTVLTSEYGELTAITHITNVQNPNNQVVVNGYKGQFTAAATGEGLKYRWYFQRPDGTIWSETAMEGCEKPTVYIESTAARNGYKYKCKITDVTGNVVYTEVATMQVLSFTAHPQETFAATGSTVTMSVETSVEEGFEYEWWYSKNNGATWFTTTMEGYNTDTLHISATGKNGYMYKCVLTGSKNSKIESKPATLHVGDAVVISSQTGSQTVAAADNAVFTVDATNVYSYQWMYSKTEGQIWAKTTAEGNQTATLTISAKGKNGYWYRCDMKGLDGNMYYTDIAVLTVQ